ncbi:mtnA [Mytilus edulis]|uniref:MtnA n=1 Tax=Mytilus edulis TaxID=6550 RepID=A0A8S3QED4_MYTED|nr:mtnA [Mytilus edulis]
MIKNTEDGWNAIKKMQIRGAPAIAVAVELIPKQFSNYMVLYVLKIQGAPSFVVVGCRTDTPTIQFEGAPSFAVVGCRTDTQKQFNSGAPSFVVVGCRTDTQTIPVTIWIPKQFNVELIPPSFAFAVAVELIPKQFSNYMALYVLRLRSTFLAVVGCRTDTQTIQYYMVLYFVLIQDTFYMLEAVELDTQTPVTICVDSGESSFVVVARLIPKQFSCRTDTQQFSNYMIRGAPSLVVVGCCRTDTNSVTDSVPLLLWLYYKHFSIIWIRGAPAIAVVGCRTDTQTIQ